MRFQWNASALCNPIQPPAKAEPWGWPFVLGGFFFLVGYLSGSRSSSNEIPFALIAVGIGLFFLNTVRARLGGYGRWAASQEGHRYNEIQRDIETAATAFARVTADRRAAAEREKHARSARDQDYLLKLSPRDFERHVADLFAALGYVEVGNMPLKVAGGELQQIVLITDQKSQPLNSHH